MNAAASQQGDGLPTEILDRLRRIEGQVRGLQKMMKQGRTPSEIIYQMAAVKSALEQAALQYLRWQTQRANQTGEAEKSLQSTLDLVAKML